MVENYSFLFVYTHIKFLYTYKNALPKIQENF